MSRKGQCQTKKMFVPFKKSKDKQQPTSTGSGGGGGAISATAQLTHNPSHASSSNVTPQLSSSSVTIHTNSSSHLNPFHHASSPTVPPPTQPSSNIHEVIHRTLPNVNHHHHHTTSSSLPCDTITSQETRASVCSSSSSSNSSTTKEEKRKSLTTTHLARLFLSNGNSVKKSNHTTNESVVVSTPSNKTLSILSSNQNTQRPLKFQNDVPKISVTLDNSSKINASPNNFQSTLERKSSKKQQKRRKYKRNKVTRKPKFFSEDGNAVIKEIDMLELDYDYEYMYGDLPDDLIIKIFQYIPVVFLARDVATVCKRCK